MYEYILTAKELDKIGDGDFLKSWQAASRWARNNIEGEMTRAIEPGDSDCDRRGRIKIFFELESDAMAFKLWIS